MSSKNVSTLARPALLLGMCVLWLSAGARLIVQYETYKPKPVLYCDGKTLAEVLYDERGEMVRCRLYELEEPTDAEPMIRGSGLLVKRPSFKAMLQLINECTFLERPETNSTVSNHTTLEMMSTWSPWSLWNGILPGTKWCGVGDIAESFEELGTQVEVDACCRAHDHCPVKLKAFRTGYGLINLSLYTKSHCDCDKSFFSCLKSSRNKVADVVGNLYFNIMNFHCIKEHRPLVCIENRTEADGTENCIKWGADPDSKKMQTSVTLLRY